MTTTYTKGTSARGYALYTMGIMNDASNDMTGVLGSDDAGWPHIIASRQTHDTGMVMDNVYEQRVQTMSMSRGHGQDMVMG